MFPGIYVKSNFNTHFLFFLLGLDPAEPYFQYTDPLVRLDPGDADFVDVIHTDGASIISGGFGMNQSVGVVFKVKSFID